MGTPFWYKHNTVVNLIQHAEELGLKILRNPFYGKIIAEIISDKQQLIEIKVVDMNGRIRTTKTQHIFPGMNKLNIIAGEDWIAGVYLLQLSYN